MNEPLIYILLACYNGEKYIEKQLDSIVAQSYTNWVLLIRDDNSSDSTLEIIESFNEKDKRVRIIQDKIQSEVKGACQNFARLLDVAVLEEATFIMFADQDDYWFSDKIEKMISAIDKDLVPAMLYSDFLYADDNLKELPKNIQNIRETFSFPSFNSLIVQNTVYGCTMMINYALAQKCVMIPREAENHDYWIALVASGIGANIRHLEIPLMLYRQHGNNVSGNYHDHHYVSRFKRLFTNWEGLKKVECRRIKMLVAFLEQLNNELLPDNLKLLTGYLEELKGNKIAFVRYCVKNKIKRHSFMSTIVFYLVLINVSKRDTINKL
ncbi:glycosyltransferase family 2 protein [Flavobacterium aquidurense]|nr:glycosyltransferase family 2 protein [Flavobacterium aquidurense]